MLTKIIMRKIKRTLVGILVIVLLIGTGLAPVTEVRASESTTASTYLDYLTSQVKAGYNGYYGGIKGIQIPAATLYDSNKYDTSQFSFVTTPKRKNVLCTDAYDMITIASKYSTVLAFGAFPSHDDTTFARPAIGYTSDGAAEIIYDVDGYDALGFDKDGYNVLGYDENGYDKDLHNKNEFMVDKIVANRDNSGKLCVSVLNVVGNKIASDNYKVSTEEISAQKGCGTYKITVKLNEKFGGKTYTQTVNILPNPHFASCFLNEAGYSRESKYYDGKVDCTVLIDYKNSALNYFDGIQYVFSKDKNFEKIYAKNTITLKKKSEKECYADKEFKVKNGATCYKKYRVYVVINGKKIYSEWITYSSKITI